MVLFLGVLTPVLEDVPGSVENMVSIIKEHTNERVEGPVDLYLYQWTTLNSEYSASVLRAQKGSYMFLQVFPKKPKRP